MVDLWCGTLLTILSPLPGCCPQSGSKSQSHADPSRRASHFYNVYISWEEQCKLWVNKYFGRLCIQWVEEALFSFLALDLIISEGGICYFLLRVTTGRINSFAQLIWVNGYKKLKKPPDRSFAMMLGGGELQGQTPWKQSSKMWKTQTQELTDLGSDSQAITCKCGSSVKFCHPF